MFICIEPERILIFTADILSFLLDISEKMCYNNYENL
jgi:hypothetical protein